MALSDLMQMSNRQLNALEGAELRRAFKSVSASLRQRVKGFSNAGKTGVLPSKYKSGIRKAASFENEAEMRRYVMDAIGWFGGGRSSIKQYNKSENERREKLEDALDYQFKTDAEYSRFGKFMHEMGLRLRDAWASISDVAWELFKESERLNLDPTMLMKNFEYWEEHLEDLQKAEPLERGRDLRPSDYLKKLNLEKVTDFYKEEKKKAQKNPKDHTYRKYSSEVRKKAKSKQPKKGRTGR